VPIAYVIGIATILPASREAGKRSENKTTPAGQADGQMKLRAPERQR
jgi:hypothetical protein